MTTIKLIDQFIISDDDGITAQELFQINGLGHLYGTVYQEPPELRRGETVRYIFIIRHFSIEKRNWSVFGNRTYQSRGWAIRAFKKNKEHILKYRRNP